LELKVKTDDFLPYADKPETFWTGFYSSHPRFKYQIRETGKRIRAYNQMVSLEMLRGKNKYINLHLDDIITRIGEYEWIQGIMQHHDAITGTSYPSTIENWKYMLADSANNTSRDIIGIS